mmetsp:Transcript_28227/g.72247  ORF Transcript_28227/g.72247 Transcript_28227/m.72247 type:complete len:90 (-) Transcript_28227:2147-2416(-)
MCITELCDWLQLCEVPQYGNDWLLDGGMGTWIGICIGSDEQEPCRRCIALGPDVCNMGGDEAKATDEGALMPSSGTTVAAATLLLIPDP